MAIITDNTKGALARAKWLLDSTKGIENSIAANTQTAYQKYALSILETVPLLGAVQKLREMADVQESSILLATLQEAQKKLLEIPKVPLEELTRISVETLASGKAPSSKNSKTAMEKFLLPFTLKSANQLLQLATNIESSVLKRERGEALIYHAMIKGMAEGILKVSEKLAEDKRIELSMIIIEVSRKMQSIAKQISLE